MKHKDGVWHEKMAKGYLWAVYLAAIVGVFEFGWQVSLALVCGSWAGVYLLTPDCDFLAVTRAETRWFRDPRKGDLVSILQAIGRFHVGLVALILGFWPGLLLQHRGISHWPIVGAAVIALLALVYPLLWLLYVERLDLVMSPVGLAAFVGFAFAHLVHIVCDWKGRG